MPLRSSLCIHINYSNCYTQQKHITCSGLLKTALNNDVLPTFVQCCLTILISIVTPDRRLIQA